MNLKKATFRGWIGYWLLFWTCVAFILIMVDLKKSLESLFTETVQLFLFVAPFFSLFIIIALVLIGKGFHQDEKQDKE